MSDHVASPTAFEDERLGPQRPNMIRLLHASTLGRMMKLFKRFERYFDDSDVSKTTGARRMRRTMALLFLAYGGALEYSSLTHGGDFSVAALFFVMLAIALFVGRGGSFVYYFVPLFLGLFAYVLAGRYALRLSLPVHYLPQLRAEEWLLPGPLPSVWLQEHLYHGTTGIVETFAVVMYISHFLIPLVLGFGLAIARRGHAFKMMMFGLLVVSIFGELTFVLAPTAPPWLAEQNGYVSGIHHILKQSLYDLHLPAAASAVGDREAYDTTAAVPSLHAAFPLVCLLTCWLCRLPRWLTTALALNVAAVSFSVVYTGDHYVIDVLVGFMYGAAAVLLVRRLLGAEARQESDPESKAAPPLTAPSPVTSPVFAAAHERSE